MNDDWLNLIFKAVVGATIPNAMCGNEFNTTYALLVDQVIEIIRKNEEL